MSVVSRVFLALQGIVLGYLSLFALLVVLGSAAQIELQSFSGQDFLDGLSAMLLVLFIVSGWRIFIWVLSARASKRGTINPAWVVSASCGIVMSLVGWLVFTTTQGGVVVDYYWYRSFEVFMPGIYFIPTAIHLAAHVSIENIANKKMQATQKSARLI
jgi:hypothetical protein